MWNSGWRNCFYVTLMYKGGDWTQKEEKEEEVEEEEQEQEEQVHLYIVMTEP